MTEFVRIAQVIIHGAVQSKNSLRVSIIILGLIFFNETDTQSRLKIYSS
jgi:hypothetical protein